MATSFIESFSEDTQDKLTKAMLECSMLFSLNRNVTLNQGRKDMFLQSVFAITCSDNREWTAQDVHDVFHDKFTKEYERYVYFELLVLKFVRRYVIINNNVL